MEVTKIFAQYYVAKIVKQYFANSVSTHPASCRGDPFLFGESYSGPGGNRDSVGGKSREWCGHARSRTAPARRG